jgi:hypothetical protein
VVVAGPLLLPLFVTFGVKGVDEKVLGAALSLILLTIVLVVEVFDYAIPRLRSQKFRDEYLNQLVADRFKKSARHLRFNVMMARRKWYVLWTFRHFYWEASKGFDPGQHLDVKVRFAEWQGVCGATLRSQKPQFVDFRHLPKTEPHWLPWKNPYRLFRWQVERTRDVLAIGSVPLLVKRGTGTNPHYRVVGVLNVDAVSPEGAQWLAKNWDALKKPLLQAGTLLAVLS